MPAILYDLVVLVGLLYLAMLGNTVGAFTAAVAALEMFVAIALAVLLHEPIASFLTPLVDDNLAFMLPDWLPLHAWTLFLVFATLLWGTVFLLWTFVHPRVSGPAVETRTQLDRAGGAIVGWFGGMLAIGAVMISLSMLPFGLLQFPSRYMMLDVGSTALRAGGAFAGERHEGRSIVLYGEPTSRESETAANLANEAWFDVDGNGQREDSDPYFDSDGNGTFTKELYYLDLDADGRRRVGLLEKYTLGRWDLAVAVGNRERADRVRGSSKPPAVTSPKPPAGPPPDQPPPTAQQQPAGKPRPNQEPKPPVSPKPPVQSGTKTVPPPEPPTIDEF